MVHAFLKTPNISIYSNKKSPCNIFPFSIQHSISPSSKNCPSSNSINKTHQPRLSGAAKIFFFGLSLRILSYSFGLRLKVSNQPLTIVRDVRHKNW